jgi:hypothetical protein
VTTLQMERKPRGLSAHGSPETNRMPPLDEYTSLGDE